MGFFNIQNVEQGLGLKKNRRRKKKGDDPGETKSASKLVYNPFVMFGGGTYIHKRRIKHMTYCIVSIAT